MQVKMDNYGTKERGAFFTPPALARFLANWAIHSAEDRVLEPSCGEASFLLAAGAAGAGSTGDRDALVGIEIHAPSAQRAMQLTSEAGLATRIIQSDFFDVAPSTLFDVVLGNPPFIRYQSFVGEDRAKGLAAALKQGVRLNKMASAWAAFLIHACSFLKPDGRLGMVLPAELLSVNYASSVREFLMRRFSALKIIAFEQQVFPSVQEEVVLLLAAGTGSTDKFELFQARNASDLPGALDKRWPTYTPPQNAEKWTHAFLRDDALSVYRAFGSKKKFEQLSNWGRAYLGCVTGANEFFLVSESDATRLGLNAAELIPMLPPGSGYQRGLEVTKSAWEELRREGKKTLLFAPNSDRLSKAAKTYIEYGEAEKLNLRYKCKVRTPWWRVPLVPPPDLAVTYMTQEGLRLISNTARLRITNSHYGFAFSTGRKKLGRDLLPLAALNSLTLLGSEIEGRAYGGGLLKIEPREVERVPVPSLSLLADASQALLAVRPQVASALRSEKLDKVCEPVDEILLQDFMGLNRGEIRELRSARRMLLERRLSRNKRPQ